MFLTVNPFGIDVFFTPIDGTPQIRESTDFEDSLEFVLGVFKSSCPKDTYGL